MRNGLTDIQILKNTAKNLEIFILLPLCIIMMIFISAVVARSIVILHHQVEKKIIRELSFSYLFAFEMLFVCLFLAYLFFCHLRKLQGCLHVGLCVLSPHPLS